MLSDDKTAFVLAGGGSLAATQVGMLRALYERDIAPDFVIGVSAGGLNAAFIASRPQTPETAAELGELWQGFRGGFAINPIDAAAALAHRRASFARVKDLPEVLSAELQFEHLEEAPMPVHIMATDVVRGEGVILSRGPLVTALLASTAIPGVLPPVQWGDRWLVDGGIANNAPVDAALGFGGKRVYLLSAGNPRARRELPRGILGMAIHALGLLHLRQAMLDVERLEHEIEVTVMPPVILPGVDGTNFAHSAEMAEVAYETSSAWLDQPGGPVGRVPPEWSPAAGETDTPASRRARRRPASPRSEKAAFVLGGGGAIGCGQVGMLRALFERNITPDVILGTSVGAVNGALLASRPPTVATTSRLAEVWRRLRRWQVQPAVPGMYALGLIGRRRHVLSPLGLQRLLRKHVQFELLEDATIPFHVLAADLHTGDERLLSSGDATNAVLAATAMPGIFPPVEWEGELLVAGDVADNTPIQQAVELGAERVYVLPGASSAASRLPQTIAESFIRCFSIAHAHHLTTEVELLKDHAEIVILPPPVGPYMHTDFGHTSEIIRRAYRAAAEFLDSPSRRAGEVPAALHYEAQ